MTTRKSNGAKPTTLETNSPAIADLFGIDTGASGFDWVGLDSTALRTLVEYVGRSGGLVSLGSSNSGTRVYISLRLDKSSKGYDFETPALFNDFITRVLDSWKLKAREVEANRKTSIGGK